MAATNQLTFSINIPVSKINTVLKWVVIASIFFLIGTWVHHEQHLFVHRQTTQFLLMELNLALENVVAAWYSSMLLFLVAIMAVICYWADRQHISNSKSLILNYGWLMIAGAFFMLSFDEMGSFHETIGALAIFKKRGTDNQAGWYLFYTLGGLVVVFMIMFFQLEFRKHKKALILTIIGILLYLSNPFQERYEHYTWDLAGHHTDWHRPAYLLLIEEGSELLAAFCFLYAFTIYAISKTTINNTGTSEKSLQLDFSIPKKNFFISSFLLLISLGLLMFIIYANAWHNKADDIGKPQNWFPSIAAFFTFLICSYQAFNPGSENKKDTGIYLMTAAVSLFTSAYFGADIYNYLNGIFTWGPYLLLAFIIIAATVLLIKSGTILARIASLAWIVFIILSIFNKGYFDRPLFGFIASSCLVIALFQNIRIGAKQHLTISSGRSLFSGIK